MAVQLDHTTSRVLLDVLAYVSLTAKFTFHSFEMGKDGNTFGDLNTSHSMVTMCTALCALAIHLVAPSDDSAAGMQLHLLNAIITSPWIITNIIKRLTNFWPDGRVFSVALSFCALLIPGCGSVYKTWVRVGSFETYLLVFTACGCVGTTVGLVIWGIMKNYQLGPAHERMEKQMTSAPKIIILSGYNAVVEEVMYRGIYLCALMHHQPTEVTSFTLMGPGVGLLMSAALCLHLDVWNKLMQQNTSEPWRLQSLDIAIVLMIVLGSIIIVKFAAVYDTKHLLNFHTALGILVQAFVFAEGHRVGGLPQGKQGMLMLFAWASTLGMERLLSDGMLLIWFVHILGDSTIGFLILWISHHRLRKSSRE